MSKGAQYHSFALFALQRNSKIESSMARVQYTKLLRGQRFSGS